MMSSPSTLPAQHPTQLPAQLQALTPSARGMLAPLLRPWHARKGAMVFHQRAPMPALYFLHAGFVRYDITQADGQQLLLGFSKPGECFGDLEIFTGAPTMSSAVAHTAVSGWQLDAELAIEALDAVPGFAKLMTSILARVSLLHRGMYMAAALQSPAERLAMALLWLSSSADGQEDPDQPLLQISQTMLAEMLALSRQCISKHLQQWRDAGWIAAHYRGLRVVNRPAIAALLPDR